MVERWVSPQFGGIRQTKGIKEGISNSCTLESLFITQLVVEKMSLTLTASSTEEQLHKVITSNKKVVTGIKYGPDPRGLSILPEPTKERFRLSGVDISEGYPEIPDQSKVPIYLDEAFAIRDQDFEYIERGKNADPEKKLLFSAATEVRDLTKHIGTEIIGLQLADLNDQQKDELARLVAERVVVFFRDQKLSPQKQLELGEYWGQVERHPQATQVPGLSGVTVIWNDYRNAFGGEGEKLTFKRHNFRNTAWHTDLVHEHQPAGITHLHNDTIPEVGGDTVWASGYAAYDKLSPAFQKWLDGKKAVYFSAHSYLERENPLSGPKRIERVHPLVRVHPVTGWKSLYVNRSMTKSIVGLEPKESEVILDYLYKLYENNIDIQVRFNWKPSKPGYGTSLIWDNRISQHRAVFDYVDEKQSTRHGTRVTSLAEKPFFEDGHLSQRELLGLSLN